jgi:hypothetical protein
MKDAGFRHFNSIADYQESLLDRLFPDGNSVRKALLFPEEERVICKVEMEPALYGDMAVRVASAM